MMGKILLGSSYHPMKLKMSQCSYKLKKELLSLYTDINRKSNIMAGMMLEVKTIFANDNDIVKMLMQGCNMAIISMTEIIHDLGITDMKLRKLANDLEDVSKRYEEKLKAYL